MSPARRTICTLCNKSFSPGDDADLRCPYCLRKTGVVQVADNTTSAHRTFRPSRRLVGRSLLALLILAGLVAALVMALPCLVSPGPELPLELCRERQLPCPWPSEPTAPGPLAADIAPQDRARVLADLLARHGGPRMVSAPPDRLHDVTEFAATTELPWTPVEAVAFAAFTAWQAGWNVLPCTPGQTPPGPLWQRPYGLCDPGTEGPFFVPGSKPWQGPSLLLDGPRFSAHFLAAAAECPIPARESYRLLAAARELHDEPLLRFRLGALKIRNGAPEFGIEDLRTALAAGLPASGNQTLGEALLDIGLPADALAAFRQAGDAAQARLGVARSQALLGHTDEARKILDALRQEDPELPGLWGAVASAHLRAGEREEAIEALRRECLADPRRESLALLTRLLGEAEKWDEALDFLHRVEQQAPAATISLLRLRVLTESGREEDAAAALETALGRYPDNMELLLEKAAQLERAHEWRQAVDLLATLRPRNPESPELLVRLVLDLFSLDKESKGKAGQRARTTLLELEKKWPRRLYHVATILSERGDGALAEHLLEERLEDRPSDSELTAWLYFFYRVHEKPEAATALMKSRLPRFEGEERAHLERTFNAIDRYVEAGKHKRKKVE